jgi:hypothetical protein
MRQNLEAKHVLTIILYMQIEGGNVLKNKIGDGLR